MVNAHDALYADEASAGSPLTPAEVQSLKNWLALGKGNFVSQFVAWRLISTLEGAWNEIEAMNNELEIAGAYA